MKTDIEIARECKMKDIAEIAEKIGISEDNLERYGKYKAKIDYTAVGKGTKRGKLILVTAITPTAAGEGKTTTTIGLADGLSRLGKKVCVALREPSLGPVFGIKGGAAGGGYAQVVPMEDINLHFTGDFHAVGAAQNLLCAMLDNHIYQGNALNINAETIKIKRAVDMNDRQLRVITDGLGGKMNGVPRSDGFDITVASEVMAILCLASSLKDLKERLSKIIVAYDFSDKPVPAGDLKAAGAMTALLKDALKPNLVQTLEGTPAIVHGGPFANIAHGCNSVIATETAIGAADYAVTEAGFGADLGAEKFFDIKCKATGFKPSAVVLVATIRALKMHGGVKKDELSVENIDALVKGIPNLLRHASNIKNVFNLPLVVAVNRFPADTAKETETLISELESRGIKAVLSTVYEDGGKGAEDLAKAVIEIADGKAEDLKFCYDSGDTIKEKIEKIVKKVYRGTGAEFTENAEKQLAAIEKLGFSDYPVCVAKTQYSFSDDKTKICAPDNFKITVKDLKISAGAGFIVAYTGDILTMPGLPKIPAAENIDVDDNGNITGLF